MEYLDYSSVYEVKTMCRIQKKVSELLPFHYENRHIQI